jgi:ribosomal protein S18 acetylase RimI-like enzyme
MTKKKSRSKKQVASRASKSKSKRPTKRKIRFSSARKVGARAKASTKAQSSLRLTPMTQAEYDLWLPVQRAGYTQANIEAGLSPTQAEEKANADYKRLLPTGLTSPNQFLFTLRNEDGQSVGYLWYAIQGEEPKKKAFIYDIMIHDQQRGRGYGRITMQLCEESARAHNAKAIGLHVFGNNSVARRLYLSEGYEERNVIMEKVLA